jgi:hypothetical protein
MPLEIFMALIKWVLYTEDVHGTNILIDDFAKWPETDHTQWPVCESAYGSGSCLDTAKAAEQPKH